MEWKIKSNLTKCVLCILLLIKYKIYSICQWTVFKELPSWIV